MLVGNNVSYEIELPMIWLVFQQPLLAVYATKNRNGEMMMIPRYQQVPAWYQMNDDEEPGIFYYFFSKVP